MIDTRYMTTKTEKETANIFASAVARGAGLTAVHLVAVAFAAAHTPSDVWPSLRALRRLTGVEMFGVMGGAHVVLGARSLIEILHAAEEIDDLREQAQQYLERSSWGRVSVELRVAEA